MNQFAPTLKKINEKLDLPQPIKSRIILEIAADMEDAYLLYLEQGMSEREAMAKVKETFAITDSALRELTEIHQTFFRRVLGKFSEQAANRWERVVLFVVFLFIAAISAKTLTTTPFFSQASKFVFPICGFFLGIMLIAKIKFYQLYIRKDHNVKKLRRWMSWIAILGIVNLIISLTGGVFEFLALPNPSGDIFYESLRQMIKFATVGMVGSLVTILTAIIYFFLNSKIQKIEQAEASILLK